MSDKYEKILEGVLELKVGVNAIKEDLSTIKSDVRQNTTDLTEHIAGVRATNQRIDIEKEHREIVFKQHEEASQDRYSRLDERLQIVEFLPNLLRGSVRVLKWAGSISAASLAISKLLGLW